jgi:hypothetical protein
VLKQYRKIIFILTIVIFVLAIAGAVYFSFFYLPKCQNYECFQNYMSRCSKAAYVNDESEASWGYNILGTSNGDCAVKVSLLMAKKGELGIDKYVDDAMTCYYPKGVAAYPEQDLSKCHGQLKEDLQEIIINKLHSYLLENLGKFDESLNKV